MTIQQADVIEWIKAYASAIAENRNYLTQLDAAIGDADHGANMDRGFKAVLAKLPELADKDIGTLLKTVGMTLVSTVGGAGGPLYGTFFLQAGAALSGKTEASPQELVSALEAGLAGVVKRGKAEPGDKTMIDTLTPALETLKKDVDAGQPLGEALNDSVQSAKQGMEATTPLVARKGRASYLGERSAGHQDPGATSSYLLFESAARVFRNGRS